MAFNPPPYDQITGICRADMKYNEQESRVDYNGNARPGELVSDLSVDPPSVWVGNNLGQLTQICQVGRIIAGTNVFISPASGVGNVTINALTGASWATLGNKNNAFGPTNIALGQEAGNLSAQGANAIALGAFAGAAAQGANSIAIGAGAGNNAQAINSIVLNATGANLSSAGPDTLVVAPVRKVTSATLPAGFLNMAYDPLTGEVIYWGP